MLPIFANFKYEQAVTHGSIRNEFYPKHFPDIMKPDDCTDWRLVAVTIHNTDVSWWWERAVVIESICVPKRPRANIDPGFLVDSMPVH